MSAQSNAHQRIMHILLQFPPAIQYLDRNDRVLSHEPPSANILGTTLQVHTDYQQFPQGAAKTTSSCSPSQTGQDDAHARSVLQQAPSVNQSTVLPPSTMSPSPIVSLQHGSIDKRYALRSPYFQ